jgi:plastocyanin
MRLVRSSGLMAAMVLAVALLAACGDDEGDGGGTGSPTRAPGSPTEAAGGATPFFLEIAVENTAYDVSELTAPAGVDLTLQFDNDDPDIQHNWSLYETPESEDPIFEGDILTGVDTIDYAIPAIEEPGTYHFHCDIHPSQMEGELIVE